MVTPADKRSSNKFCEFHNDKGHSTDECMQIKKQIEELVKAGKLSHFIKEIRQDKDKQKNRKKEAPTKEKAAAIYMIHPWHRVIRQKVTLSFAQVNETTFPPLSANKGTEGPLVIEAKIGGHVVHQIKSQMVPATTSLTGFSGETIWPLGQLRLLVTIEDAEHFIKARMNFMIVRSPSPYNGIIGRPGIREIQAVPSMAHGMLKFPVDGGVSIFSSCYLFRNPFSSTTMGDENPIRTLGDYSKPSHEGYRNTIELLDPNQHLKDFLKLVDSLDLDGKNRERTRLRLFQFSLRDQASNWLERLLAGSITTWEDLTSRFLDQFFPSGRTAKLRNDIPMFQQHHGESLSEAWTRFKDLLQKVPHHGIDLWLQNLTFYDNESWNDPRDFAKPVKAIALPQEFPSTSDRRLIELENQVQCLMEAHLAPTQPTQVNKITTLCEICSGSHDTQYCMEDPEQVFVKYASSRTDEAGEDEEDSSTNACDLNLGSMVKGKEEVKEQGKEENEMETDKEVDE
ncbi:MAK10-like protein [Tanacetum coccineum]